MTLIVSEVSRHGIAMVGDSAVTMRDFPGSWKLESGQPASPSVRTGAEKIIPVFEINAAIACWGFGSIGTELDKNAQIPIDDYLMDFANTVKASEALEQMGNRLAQSVNKRVEIGKKRGGFHIAGYVKENDKSFPALYHIHTGNPDKPPQELKLYKDCPFGLHPKRTVDQYIEELFGVSKTKFYLRNGDFQVYAKFWDKLKDLMPELERDGFICPDPRKFKTELEARAHFIKLQVQTICEFYRLSNRIESIAQPISWITISPSGIEHWERIRI